MHDGTGKPFGVGAARATQLRHLLDINAACGDLGESTERRFKDTIDAAEGRAPAANIKDAVA